jgi:hypothetical protein
MGIFGRRRPASIPADAPPTQPIDITVMGWRVVFHGGEFHVTHDNTPLSIEAAITTMPVWGPLVIEELGRITHVLRDQITKPVTMGMLPIESAPRDGTRVDLWVKPSHFSTAYRATDCAYSLMRSVQGQPVYGWHNGQSDSWREFSADEIKGWTPIAKP